MKCRSLGLLAVMCAAGASAAAPAGDALLPPATKAPPSAVRPGTFAAGSAASPRRLSAGQRDEWRFLKDAAAAARFEQEASRMAIGKSTDPKVRSLAAVLVNHHANALPVLHRMLHVRSMAEPMLSNEQRHSLNQLAKLNGPKFDREWMSAVGLRSQQDSVAVFEKAAATAQDPQMRAWIERTLPTLRYQLQAAERAVSGTTKFASLAPQVAIKSRGVAAAAPANLPAHFMGAAPATATAGDLGEGNMLLGPARPVAITKTEASTR